MSLLSKRAHRSPQMYCPSALIGHSAWPSDVLPKRADRSRKASKLRQNDDCGDQEEKLDSEERENTQQEELVAVIRVRLKLVHWLSHPVEEQRMACLQSVRSLSLL